MKSVFLKKTKNKKKEEEETTRGEEALKQELAKGLV